MPKYGYTKMFEKMLNHKNIEVILNTDYKSILDSIKFDKMIYTGPIDYFFNYKFGKMPYRSIRFEFKNFNEKIIQKAAVYNYLDPKIEFSRVTEYKILTQQNGNTTTLSYEFFQDDGEPFYPVPTNENRRVYDKFKRESEKIENVIFCGRLAEYQYYNMDQVVANIIHLLKDF
jgi:UDP-galactopyranose mutase